IQRSLLAIAGALMSLFYALPGLAQVHPEPAGATPAAHAGGGEANLIVPHLDDAAIASFMGGNAGSTLLYGGLVVSALGMLFGFMIYTQLKNMPVHKSMLEISELIYETCKTYLGTQ